MAGKLKRNYDLDRLIGKVIDYEGVLKHIQNGDSLSESCQKFNVDIEEMRRFMSTEHLDFCFDSISRAKLMESTNEALGYERLYLSLIGYTPNSNKIKKISEIPYDIDKGFINAMKTLTNRERTCVKEYYLGGLTLDQVAARHNVTRERIRQVIAKACRKLRHPQRYRMWIHGWDFYVKSMELRRKETELTYSEELAKFEDHVIDVVEQKDKEKMLEIYYDLQRLVTSEDFFEARAKMSSDNDPIDILELSVRSYNCLKRAGYQYMKDLKGLKYSDLMKMRNLGRKSAEEIIERCMINGINIIRDATNGFDEV